MNQLRRAAGATVLAAGLLTSACGGDDTDPRPTPSASATTKDGLTAPGSTLELGDTAVVSRTNGSGVVELTVTAIEKARSAELADLGYDADRDGPAYYVRYAMTLRSGEGYGMTMQNYLYAWADGKQAGSLVPSRPFPTCQEANFAPDAAPGATVTSCRIYRTEPSTPAVDTIWFDDDARFDSADGDQISWK